MSRKRVLLICLAVVVVLGTVWVAFNPPGRFGLCRFGLTVYSGIPFPAVDVVVHANGLPGVVATYQIVKRLPRELKGQLPSPEEIAKLLEDGV